MAKYGKIFDVKPDNLSLIHKTCRRDKLPQVVLWSPHTSCGHVQTDTHEQTRYKIKRQNIKKQYTLENNH